MSRTVTIFGGSGFAGRYISRRLAQLGWRVRVAVRRPNEALFVRTFGTVGQVEPVLANIRDEASSLAVIKGADAVVNCVGILQETRRQKFDTVHDEAAARIARLATESGVKHLVHLSAIGADIESDSHYARSKARGDASVMAEFPGAVVLRPSLLFGPEDNFFNRFATLAKFSLVLPVVGGETRFQPVYVDDVARAAVAGVSGGAAPGIYELGGPSVHSFRDLLRLMLEITRRRRAIVNLPFAIARVDAWLLDLGFAMTGGLFVNKILTRDQVRQLGHDNVVGKDARGLDELGITAMPMDAILESYLYCHRPSGQYTAIKESARGLRG